MTFQFGKNPEYTISVWFSVKSWCGEIAFPLSLFWRNTTSVKENRNINISIRFLCFGFSLEIWKWAN